MSGIFKGKKMKFNKLILRGLFYGEKTTQQIAEFIYQNDPAPKGTRRQIRHIRIAIERSRLPELNELGYISRDDLKKWELTFKGLVVASSLVTRQELEHRFVVSEKLAEIPALKEFQDFVMSSEFDELVELFDVLFDFNKLGPKKYERGPPWNAYSSVLRGFFGSGKWILDLRDLVESLEEQGHDFDHISAEESRIMFVTRAVEAMMAEELGNSVLAEGGVCLHCGRMIIDERFKFCPYCASPLS